MPKSGVDYRELKEYRKRLAKLIEDMPEVISKLTLQEGLYAAGQARRIATGDKVVNTGAYRQNFHAGNRDTAFEGDTRYDGSEPVQQGGSFSIDVYNNLEYALYLEKGFRRHFVPGHWEGRVFVYQRGDPEGGMTVGPHPGHWTLRRAIEQTKKTQAARLQRKVDKILKARLEGNGYDEVTE